MAAAIATDLLSDGWTRHFVERTKYGNERYVWDHAEHGSGLTYQQAMSAYRYKMRNGMTPKQWKAHCAKVGRVSLPQSPQ